jgi:hypothetical protein
MHEVHIRRRRAAVVQQPQQLLRHDAHPVQSHSTALDLGYTLWTRRKIKT